jgi:UDP-N-acetylglucosamine acyltransferase
VGDRALVSGNCVVHQFVRIGRLSLMRGLSRTSRDIPPFCIADGTHTVHAVNVLGLRRAGWSALQINAVRQAFRTLFMTRRNLKGAVDELFGQGPLSPEVLELVEFIRGSRRGVAFGPRDQGGAVEE